MTTDSLWRQAVGTLDTAITPAVERVAHDETFGLLVAVLHRTRRGAGSRIERASRHLLHALNLPAGSDVNRLLTQIASVERELRDLRKSIADHGPPT
jgi:hypothetical protein